MTFINLPAVLYFYFYQNKTNLHFYRIPYFINLNMQHKNNYNDTFYNSTHICNVKRESL